MDQCGKINWGILCFDSYYYSAATRKLLADSKVLYTASVCPTRVKNLFDKVKDKVDKPNDWNGIFNSISGELFVHVWDSNKDIGKKCVMSNAFKRLMAKGNPNIIPA